jgi:hypothetical protein
MTSEIKTPDTGLDDLLNRHFAGRVVRKDLTKLVKEGANVPVYHGKRTSNAWNPEQFRQVSHTPTGTLPLHP